MNLSRFLQRVFAFSALFSLSLFVSAQWNSGTGEIYYNAGNVGIGVAAPAARLDVFMPGSTSPQYGLLLHSGTFNTSTNAQNSYFLKAMDDGGGQTKFILTGDGSVGINLANPLYALSVGGDICSSNSLITTGGDVFIARTSFAYGYVVRPNIDGYRNLAFSVSGGGPLDNVQVISNITQFTGNVGIGTNNPGSNKLAVEGTIGARKIVVTPTNPFPDYVFNPGYRLPSLKSVAQFITTNRHLPEIPSANSVEKKGLDLGETQTVLLKKIEELTLYAINQQKQLERQQKEIERLQQQNKRIDALEAKINAAVAGK